MWYLFFLCLFLTSCVVAPPAPVYISPTNIPVVPEVVVPTRGGVAVVEPVMAPAIYPYPYIGGGVVVEERFGGHGGRYYGGGHGGGGNGGGHGGGGNGGGHHR